jgi:hypothetical protein
MPSYEERLMQMEAVLKTSVTNNYYGEQGLGPRYMLECSAEFPPFGRVYHNQNALCGRS